MAESSQSDDEDDDEDDEEEVLTDGRWAELHEEAELRGKTVRPNDQKEKETLAI